MVTSRVRVLLSIAGSDSSAGAGIAADLKTAAAFGVFGTTAITAVTAQNAFGVSACEILSPQLLRAQIDAIVKAHSPDAVKLGMLGNPETILEVARFLDSVSVPVVVDPVMAATSGASLWQGEDPARLYLSELLPKATIATPNIPEAAILLHQNEAQNYEQMQSHALALLEYGAEAVLVKGGHLQDAKAADCLATRQGCTPFVTPRVATPHSHGSGCTLATAIACGLASGLNTLQSVAAAKAYVQGALEHSGRLNLVADNGPLHHFYSYW